MNDFDLKELQKLSALFDAFYGFIKNGDDSTTHYAKRNVERIRRNIELALKQKNASSEVFSELRSSYNSMFPPKSGLSEFYIWDDDFETRVKLNLAYEEVKNQIEKILSI